MANTGYLPEEVELEMSPFQETVLEANKRMMDKFQKWMEKQKLSEKTIRKHLDYVDFYLNFYILQHLYDPEAEGRCGDGGHPEPYRINDGCCRFGTFMDFFFIPKCLWSTPTEIRGMAAAVKKFYKCMAEVGDVEAPDYEALCEDIKDGLQNWVDNWCGPLSDF